MAFHFRTSLERFLRRFARDERGVYAILFALILPMLLGMVGIAVEVGYWYSQKRDMQSAADAAAMAGAYELLEGNGTAAMVAAGHDSATRNGHTLSRDPENPPWTGAYTGDSTAVMAEVESNQAPIFSGVLGLSAFTISVRATAHAAPLSDACVIALSPTSASTLGLLGTADVNMSGCGMAVNSNDSTAFSMVGSSALSGPFVRVTGGSDISNNASNSAPVTNNSPSTLDPYSTISATASGSCITSGTLGTYVSGSGGNTSYTAAQGVKINGGTYTMQPGRYCNGFSTVSDANVTMAPGTYYIDGGSFSLSAQTQISGTGVTIVLTGSGSDYATMDIQSANTVVDISAPTSGTYQGLVVVQDRNAPEGNNNVITGGSSTNFNGTMYLPNGDISYRGGAVAGGGCTRIISYTIQFTGNADLNNDCNAYGYSNQLSSRPVLVE
ncbi:MAG: pilus assembly protein [Alphaproteobacteria bacterium]|nr:pilus assembly protein [Alphaproteobacteria bacterium]